MRNYSIVFAEPLDFVNTKQYFIHKVLGFYLFVGR